jgi:hypothetical protein
VAGYGAAARADFYRTSDFLCVWGGARAVLEHADPYDRTQWERIVGRPTVEANGQVVRICPDRSRYPLWTSVLVAPIGALPLETAAVVWAALNLVAVLLAIRWVWSVARGQGGGALYAALVLTSQPLWLLAANGQLGGLVVGAIALELWLAGRQRFRSAGAVAAILAAKPQAVALYLLVRVARAVLRREWRYLLGAALAGLALVAVSVALLPTWPAAWLGDVFGGRAGIHQRLATAWDLAELWFGASWLGAVLAAALAATVVLIVRGRSLALPDLAGLALAVSVFAAPYAWSYDHLALAVPWGVTLANAARTNVATRLRLGVAAIASVLPWSLYVLAFQRGDEALAALVPAVAAILLAISIRARRSSG